MTLDYPLLQQIGIYICVYIFAQSKTFFDLIWVSK